MQFRRRFHVRSPVVGAAPRRRAKCAPVGLQSRPDAKARARAPGGLGSPRRATRASPQRCKTGWQRPKASSSILNLPCARRPRKPPPSKVGPPPFLGAPGAARVRVGGPQGVCRPHRV
eukprot:2812019-Pyramimonas_sp.AAC.1